MNEQTLVTFVWLIPLLPLLAFFLVANYALVFISLFVLRWKEPDAPRPFKAWGHPVTPGLALLGIILAPIAALVIQLAVSRGREYLADSTGASLTGDPEGLAQALERLGAHQERHGLLGRLRGRQAEPATNPAFGHLWIVSPLSGSSLSGLFSTHPPLPARIARLRSMRITESTRG